MRPKVSVIISTEGTSAFLEKAIISVLNQTYQDWELRVLFDGCSIPEKFVDLKNKKNIKIYESNQKLGLANALNFLIDESNGELIARMDDDDLMKPHRLARQVSEFEGKKIDLCCSMAELIDLEGQVLGHIPKKFRNDLLYFLIKNPIIHPTVMYKKEWVLQNKYEPTMMKAQDWELWLRSFHNCNILFIPEVLLSYRRVRNNNIKKRITTYKYQLYSLKYLLRGKLPWYFRIIAIVILQVKLAFVTIKRG